MSGATAGSQIGISETITAIGILGGIAIQAYIAYKTRQQTKTQGLESREMQIRIADENRNQLMKQSNESIGMQRLITNRTIAAFIADKRQKWIDELRVDMAAHLALSQVIAWKWLALYQEAESVKLGGTLVKEAVDMLDKFSDGNGTRDHEHQERHIRLLLRLNGKEEAHIMLIGTLNEIRRLVSDLGLAKSSSNAFLLVKEMEQKIADATQQTNGVLKDEWTRIKQEVAHPEHLLSTIPSPYDSKTAP
jgi:hypothetical protein